MSNVKAIDLSYRVPYDWPEKLDAEDAKFVLPLVLIPVIGIEFIQRPAGYDPVPETGGQRAMYELAVVGEEALAWPALDRLASILDTVGERRFARAVDIQEGYDSTQGWLELGAGNVVG